MSSRKISTTARLTIGLISLTASLLLAAQLLDLMPNRTGVALDARKDIAEAIATQLSWSASQNDFRTIQMTLSSIIGRSDEIQSAALRRTTGEPLVIAGNHNELWVEPEDGVSTATHIIVPLFSRDSQWGVVEMTFAALEGGLTFASLRNSVFGLLGFIVIIGGLGFFLLLRRALRELDPSGVIPDRVKGAFDSLAEGVLIMDEHEHIVLANESFSILVERPIGKLSGRKASSLEWRTMRAGDNADNLPWLKAMRSGSSEKGVPLLIQVPSGQLKTFRVNGAPILDGAGKARGALATFDDVTDVEKKNTDLKRTLKKLEKSTDEVNRQNVELRFLATRDPLTGCLNRRAFFERCDVLFDEAKEQGTPLSCIMADLDHFKSVNDKHGHSVGDDVICFMADVLRAETRDDDLVCRYGGEEFCVIMPGLDLDDASQVAGRLCKRIREMSSPHFKGKLSVTVSVGVATQMPDHLLSMDLVNQADTALYAAKESGRDRFARWGDQLSADVTTMLDTATALTRRIKTTMMPGMTTGAHEIGGKDIQRLRDRIVELENKLEGSDFDSGTYGAFDEVTGLPNRILFFDRLNELHKRSERQKLSFAVLHLDIDVYNHIKDTLGSEAGDGMLVTVLDRMAAALRNSDIVAYIGGGSRPARLSRLSSNEFGIVLTDLADPESIPWILQRLFDCLDEPVKIGGQEIYASCCVGISVYPNDCDDVRILVRQASIARSHAKEIVGRNKYMFYAEEMNNLASQRIRLDAQMRHALDAGQFMLVYQPKMDLGSGEVTAMEALIRWQHPKTGLVNPSDFIPIAEKTGFIVNIGQWVLRQACTQAKEWIDKGLPDIRIAVNVSMVQLATETFIDDLHAILEETGAEPRNLELEITETAVMADVEVAARQLQDLRASGVFISVDDFGTGYSSLAYLKSFALDYLKLDSAFVAEMDRELNDAALVAAVIAMAHRLGLRVVAEGVETQVQLDHLRHLQCDEVQGYFLSEPIPADQAGELLFSGRPLIAPPLEAKDLTVRTPAVNEDDIDRVLRASS